MTDANKVIIIGNGFDLNLKLPTSYTNFIDSEVFQSRVRDGNITLFNYLNNKRHINNWIDVELELANYSNATLEVTSPEIFLYQYKMLCNALLKYLSEIETTTPFKGKAYELLEKEFDNQTLIVNFNYTNSIESVLNDLRKTFSNEQIYKIHYGIKFGGVIFGVDDSTKINKQHAFLWKSATILRGVPRRDLFKTLMDAEEVIFFGHSLGKTDHQYFKEFFDRAATNAKTPARKIKFHYYNEDAWLKMAPELMELTGGLQRLNDKCLVELIACEEV